MTALCALESIARTGSFSRGARDQELTTAGFGISIRRLETAIGLELSCPDPRNRTRKILTEAGREMAAAVHRFIAALETFFERHTARRPTQFRELSLSRLCDLEAFARTGGVSRAAKMEGRTSPNVSIGLSGLNQGLGLELTTVDPVGSRRRVLTEAGAELAATVSVFRAELDRIHSEFYAADPAAETAESDSDPAAPSAKAAISCMPVQARSSSGSLSSGDALKWLAKDEQARVVIDANRKVRWTNLSASGLLNGRALYLANGRLCVADSANEACLDAFLSRLSTREARWLVQGAVYDTSIMLTGHRLNGDASSPIFLAMRSVAVQRSCEQSGMGRDFGLRPSECRVVDGYLQGKSPPDLARDLALSMNTIRTHTRVIYRKLGITNGRELIMLATAYCGA